MQFLLPPSGLLTRVDSGAPKVRSAGPGVVDETYKLSLASSEWFRMQACVSSMLALPSNMTEFETRYGDASSGLLMKDSFDAMYELQALGVQYGSPKALRSKITSDPAFLAKQISPSNDAYTTTIWTLNNAASDSMKLASILKNLPQNAAGEPPTEVVNGLKTLILSSDGIVGDMAKTVTRLDELIKKFEKLEDELVARQTDMKKFTDRSSATMKELTTQIGTLQSQIDQLQKDRDAAYDRWMDLTIASVAAAAAIAVIGVAIGVILAPTTAGTSLAIGAAVTAGVAAAAGSALGIAAALARSSYDGLVTELASQQTQLRKRAAYSHDLTAMDSGMKFTLPASSGLGVQLKVIRSSWDSSIQELKATVGDLSVDSLVTGPWLKREEMANCGANWTRVSEAFSAFVVGGFADYSSVNFGDPMPKDDPNFVKKLGAA